MDYKGLKICKILKPTYLEDNKVFLIAEVDFCYEINNNLFIVSGDNAGKIILNIETIKVNELDEEISCYGWVEDINELKKFFPTNDILELKDNIETLLLDKMYYFDFDNNIIEPYDFNFDDEFEDNETMKDENDSFKEIEKYEEKEILPPIKGISEKIKKKIINQDEAINQILAAIYGNRQIIENENLTQEEKIQLKKSVLIYGNTGTGKTEIIRQISNYLNLPILVEDATKYTAEGYQGSSVSEMLIHLYKNCNNDIEKAQNSILVIDEIDKKKEKENVYSPSTTDVLFSLLKIIEGETFMIPVGMDKKYIKFDTSNLIIVLCGRFEGVDKSIKNKKSIGFNSSEIEIQESVIAGPERFVELGIPGEFIGRNSCIVKTNDLDVNDLKNIITCSTLSVLLLKKKFYEINNVKLKYDDDFITFLAEEAYKTKSGARGIKQALESIIKDLEFDILSGNIREVILTRNGIITKEKNKKSFKRTRKENLSSF